MGLYEFLHLGEHEQKRILANILSVFDSVQESDWMDSNETPNEPGYYLTVSQYGKWKHTQRPMVARWSGSHWGECYDNERTTRGRYTTWDVIKWTYKGAV